MSLLHSVFKKFLRNSMLAAAIAITAPLQAAVILEYHHVSDTGPASTRIAPKDFIAQLDYLKSAGFEVVPLLEMVAALKRGETLPHKQVAITFDDSYASVYSGAFPILRARQLPFTFFVNTDAVGTGAKFVSWAQLREMQAAGATIANHTATHAHMTRPAQGESMDAYAARLDADIERAQRALIRELGSAPAIFAYPFGEYNAIAKQVVAERGLIGFGQHSGAPSASGDLHIIPRFPFGGSFTDLADFKLKVNTKALPVTRASFFTASEAPLKDVIVVAGDKPWLKLELADTALAKSVRCYATGQGAIPTQVRDGAVWAQAKAVFKPGRMRYNCTAPSDERGRFYWFTQQWLVTDAAGQWLHQD